MYFLINGIFYSESYISVVFNSKKPENFLVLFQDLYIDLLIVQLFQIISSIMQVLTVDENIVVNILKKGKTSLDLRFEISEILKSIILKNRILIIIII